MRQRVFKHPFWVSSPPQVNHSFGYLKERVENLSEITDEKCFFLYILSVCLWCLFVEKIHHTLRYWFESNPMVCLLSVCYVYIVYLLFY